MRLRVLTYNVHKFFNITNSQYILNELKQRMSELDLDIVFLQEMRGIQPEKFKGDYKLEPLEHLADEIWDHFVYGKNAVYSTGHHGNAILSKHPFKSWLNHDMSNHAFERRSLLEGVVEYGGLDIALACTHLDLTEWGRKKQQQKIIETLKLKEKINSPLILAGDFNDWRGRSRKIFCDLGLSDIFTDPLAASSFTYPSVMPILSLDKMYFANLRCVNSAVLNASHWRKLSDHLPIFAEFEIDRG